MRHGSDIANQKLISDLTDDLNGVECEARFIGSNSDDGSSILSRQDEGADYDTQIAKSYNEEVECVRMVLTDGVDCAEAATETDGSDAMLAVESHPIHAACSAYGGVIQAEMAMGGLLACIQDEGIQDLKDEGFKDLNDEGIEDLKVTDFLWDIHSVFDHYSASGGNVPVDRIAVAFEQLYGFRCDHERFFVVGNDAKRMGGVHAISMEFPHLFRTCRAKCSTYFAAGISADTTKEQMTATGVELWHDHEFSVATARLDISRLDA